MEKNVNFFFFKFFFSFFLDNRMLGMNMKVEKVGIDRVKQKLLNLKRMPEKKIEITEEDLEKRLEELEKQGEEERFNKKNKNYDKDFY